MNKEGLRLLVQLMYPFAMAPPLSVEKCVLLAGTFGVLAFLCSSIAFRRLRSRYNVVAAAKSIIAWSLFGGLVAALAGPLELDSDVFPHWMGYNVENAVIRSFFGAIAGIVIAWNQTRCFGKPTNVTERPKRTFQYSISTLMLLATFACLIAAIFTSSVYVGTFVALELLVMIACFFVYLRLTAGDS